MAAMAASFSSKMIETGSDFNRVFYKVGGPRCSDRMRVVTEIFNRILKPLYGSQDKALTLIERSQDRTLFLLYDGNDPVGVLQFKTQPSDEFAEFGIEKSIEIKSLFVNQSQHNSGRGLGSVLLEKLYEESEKLRVDFSGFHVTVSEDKGESLAFFKKKGFEIVHTWDGRYQKGKKEHLLFRPKGKEAQEKANRVYAPRLEDVRKGEYPDEPELVHVIHNAHEDDIHMFLRLDENRFVTGSKDNTIVEWDATTRERIRVVKEVEPACEKNESWITSLVTINNGIYASGTRDGVIDVWTSAGRHLKTIRPKMPKQGHISLKVNAHRINCLVKTPNPYLPGLFVGLPTQFDQVDIITSKTMATVPAHKNDWVFAIHPISDVRLLAVVGGMITLFEQTNTGHWEQESIVLEEPPALYENGRKQRAFIQTMESMKGNDDQYILSRLDGSVEVIDVHQRQVVTKWSEHKGRVWHALNVTEHVIGSSGEDQTIQLYDIRQKQVAHTINSPIGQVNAMMCLNEHTLIAATSPQVRKPDSRGTQIRFYDVRY